MTGKRTVAVVLTALLVAVAAVYLVAQKPAKSISVGMIPLLAAPQNYNGKRIQTWGYLHIGRISEDDSLWLRKEDGDYSLIKNSFSLALSSEQRQAFSCVNHTYVLVEGTLRSEGEDNSSMDSGTITQITHLIGWSPYRDSPCESKR